MLTSGTRIDRKVGADGPKHDPYAWTELTVWRLGREVRGHFGLLMWIEIDGARANFYGDDAEKKFAADFEAAVGFGFDEAESAYFARFRRCPKCGGSRLDEASGYPGETFTICSRCETIVANDFDESAII